MPQVDGDERLTMFISTRFRASLGSRSLAADTPLFSSGIIDSFGVLELIAHLEETFGVEIDPARHELDEFDTIAKIRSLVRTLQRSESDA